MTSYNTLTQLYASKTSCLSSSVSPIYPWIKAYLSPNAPDGFFFFNVGSLSGLPLFRPSKIFTSHHTHLILMLTIMVDGATLEEG